MFSIIPQPIKTIFMVCVEVKIKKLFRVITVEDCTLMSIQDIFGGYMTILLGIFYSSVLYFLAKFITTGLSTLSDKCHSKLNMRQVKKSQHITSQLNSAFNANVSNTSQDSRDTED